jgi:hypothetical protein
MDFKTGRGKTPIPPIYRKNWQRREDVCATPTGNEALSADGGTLTIEVFSDAGLTTPIISADFGAIVYIKANPTGIVPTSYTFSIDGSKDKVISQSGDTYVWTIDNAGAVLITARATDGSGATANATAFSFTAILTSAIITDASNVARYSFEDDADLTFNGSNISQVNDLTGNGNHLLNTSAAQQPFISSHTTETGKQYARFEGDQLYTTFGSAVDYSDITFAMVLGCDDNINTKRIASITKTGQNDFNGANSIAFAEALIQKSGLQKTVKYSEQLSVIILRISQGVGSYVDFFLADGRQISSIILSGSIGSITYENVNMGRVNPNMNWAEWHIIGRKLTDVEAASYGEYLRAKWLGV